jgi:hypothetical protein
MYQPCSGKAPYKQQHHAAAPATAAAAAASKPPAATNSSASNTIKQKRLTMICNNLLCLRAGPLAFAQELCWHHYSSRGCCKWRPRLEELQTAAAPVMCTSG